VRALLFTILATVVVFWLLLAILGPSMGVPELLIWTVLLVVAVAAEVRSFRRHKASTDVR
jgi:membrane protein required for beta-lactamase induction